MERLLSIFFTTLVALNYCYTYPLIYKHNDYILEPNYLIFLDTECIHVTFLLLATVTQLQHYKAHNNQLGFTTFH